MSADFLDANVFVYLFDETDSRKRGIAADIVTQSIDRGTGAISCQVAQEALNVRTRKPNATPTAARPFLDDLLSPLWRLGPSPERFECALELRSRYDFGWYNAHRRVRARMRQRAAPQRGPAARPAHRPPAHRQPLRRRLTGRARTAASRRRASSRRPGLGQTPIRTKALAASTTHSQTTVPRSSPA
jgi:predicted nucleic acid-binding protein